jgi:DNA-binding MarR family transcriptional regulator
VKEQVKTFMDVAIENLISIMPLLSKNITRIIRTQTNLTPGSIFLLGALDHHKKLSMSEIGNHLSVPKPQATTIVDKLIADELVERLADPDDRRIIYIQITEKGKTDFEKIKRDIHHELEKRLQLLNNEQVEALSIASQQVRDILIWILQQQQSGLASSFGSKNQKG